ncbi:DNA repair protein RecO [Candidatus Saccharibacteria bacterium]|nr:DNA repair protein RecO [Candidatus Saccharibacteria bacterium]
MSKNTPAKDIRVQGIVLRRVNYGEADRILTIITPIGKISAIVKGVRKAKSRLAGGVEMFTVADLNLHQGRGDMYTVTGARMLEHYEKILKDYDKTMLAGKILKRVAAAESLDDEKYFLITRACLAELAKDETDIKLIEAWFLINITEIIEPINLYRDVSGTTLSANEKYEWDIIEKAFRLSPYGQYAAPEIKFLRLLITSDLTVIKRIKVNEEIIQRIYDFTRINSG